MLDKKDDNSEIKQALLYLNKVNLSDKNGGALTELNWLGSALTEWMYDEMLA